MKKCTGAGCPIKSHCQRFTIDDCGFILPIVPFNHEKFSCSKFLDTVSENISFQITLSEDERKKMNIKDIDIILEKAKNPKIPVNQICKEHQLNKHQWNRVITPLLKEKLGDYYCILQKQRKSYRSTESIDRNPRWRQFPLDIFRPHNQKKTE